MAHARAIQHLDIHDAEPTVHSNGETIWLTVPAPACDSDDSRVVVFLAGPERLRKLRDDINTVLAGLDRQLIGKEATP